MRLSNGLLQRLAAAVLSLTLALLPLRGWAGAELLAPAAAGPVSVAVLAMQADCHADLPQADDVQSAACAECNTSPACGGCHAPAAPAPELLTLSAAAPSQAWRPGSIAVALPGAWQAPFRPPRH